MYNTSSGEPCVGLAHLILAFPRAAALIGCVSLVSWYAVSNGETCKYPSEHLINAGDTAGSVCVQVETTSLSDEHHEAFPFN